MEARVGDQWSGIRENVAATIAKQFQVPRSTPTVS
jgi:hypothetical protein